MNSLDLPQYICEFLGRILKANGFKEYSLKNNLDNVMKGSGSELLSIDIIEPMCSKQLSIVCKIPSNDENRRKNFLSILNFTRETIFYDNILPMFWKFQEEKNLPIVDRFLSHPKCYDTMIDHVNERYAIVLENLHKHGFRMWDKRNAVPIENMRLLMCELGKLHGISFAMKDQHPAKFVELKHLEDTFRQLTETKIVRDRFNDSFDCAIKSLKKDAYKEIIRDVKKNFSHYLEYCVNNETTDRFGVLSHGNSLQFLFQINLFTLCVIQLNDL